MRSRILLLTTMLAWACCMVNHSFACTCRPPDVVIRPWEFWVAIGYPFPVGAVEQNAATCPLSWRWDPDDGGMTVPEPDNDGCSTPGQSKRAISYTSVNTFQPRAYASNSCGEDNDWALYHVVHMGWSSYAPYPYIQANDDDDDENGCKILGTVTYFQSPEIGDCPQFRQFRMTVLVTHHIPITVESWVDDVVVLVNGRIAEEGSSAQLREKGGFYQHWLNLSQDASRDHAAPPHEIQMT